MFKYSGWEVQSLVDSVASGVIQLPDLQRPFVWPKTKVRDLLDSMFRGYPVGELMFWNMKQDGESRAISSVAQHEASHQIIDGQQRLTSLFSVMKGVAVRDSDYKVRPITIAFQPFTQKFEVLTPAFERSAAWLPNVSDFFAQPFAAKKAYRQRWEAANGELSETEEEILDHTFNRLLNLLKYEFKVVEILPTTEKKTVADIFVRINSEGVSLKASDFILTWLSVFWPEGREEIEAFARDSRITPDRASEISGEKISWTPKNHFLTVDAGQLVRVLVAVGQNRAKLTDAYNALQAKDRSTGFADTERQERELQLLKDALPIVTRPLHWQEFLLCLPTVGFRSRKMITSDMNLLSSYALWLLGKTKYRVELPVLRNLIGRWVFMSQLTWRYSGSAETVLQRDLDRFDGISDGDADGFVRTLEAVIAAELSEEHWTLRMPDSLVSSIGALSPAYQCYLAALNVLDADLFMIDSKINVWTDPASTPVKGMEGHHLFPRNYLSSKLGIVDLKRINQVANFAPTDYHTNILISDRPPHEYWQELVDERARSKARLAQQMYWHALPAGWESLEYDEFLTQRRLLMAAVTRDAFNSLSERHSQTTEAVGPAEVMSDTDELTSDVGALIDLGVLAVGEVLVEADPDVELEGEITEDRQLQVGDDVFDSLDNAAKQLSSTTLRGVEFWLIERNGERLSIAEIAEMRDAEGAPE